MVFVPPDSSSLTQTLGRMVVETRFAAIPAAVVTRAKVSLLHNIAVGLAGRGRENVAAVAAQKYWAAPAEATLLHNGAAVSAEGAAFANAALMNLRSQDDTHAASTSHPGSPTMAAAMAMAESCSASGEDFLAAVILGYETLCRIGRDFDDRFTARGFRAASLLGGFGAAAATARLLKLSGAQTAHALGLQANLSGGIAQVWREGSAEANMQLAFGARNGIAAARAAACGATAALLVLEGEAGFFSAFAGTAGPARELLEGIGESWQLLEVTVKPLPICAILQGPAMLFLDSLRRRQMRPEAIESITLSLNPYEADYPGVDNPGPFASATATKLSAQFCLGLAAIEGRITPEGLERLRDETILAVARRVFLRRDAGILVRLCRVAIRLRDGEEIAGSVEIPAGQPDFSECAAFVRMLGPEIGATGSQIDRLIHEVAELEKAPDVRGLIAAAAGARGMGRRRE
jgi:2-methylcitrate dehydratase PrpD